MKKPIYVIDGRDFSSLQGFWHTVSARLIPGAEWGRNLDAFNDILRGGFGTPPGGFILIWKNSDLSRTVLGYSETVRWLEGAMQRADPSNAGYFKQQIDLAKRGEGATLFDRIVEIIRSPEHREIELRLE